MSHVVGWASSVGPPYGRRGNGFASGESLQWFLRGGKLISWNRSSRDIPRRKVRYGVVIREWR
jgi:hypothetical protein